MAAGWTNLQDPLVAFPSLVGALLLAILVCHAVVGLRSEKDVHQLGLAIQTTWSFFNQRFDFLRSSFRTSGQDIFSFKIFYVGKVVSD